MDRSGAPSGEEAKARDLSIVGDDLLIELLDLLLDALDQAGQLGDRALLLLDAALQLEQPAQDRCLLAPEELHAHPVLGQALPDRVVVLRRLRYRERY